MIAKSKPPRYVSLPRELAEKPPIRHRHADRDGTDVTPFEFAILSAVLVAARLTLDEARRKDAFAAGHESIEQKKILYENFRERWRITKKKRRAGAEYAEAPTPQRRHAFDVDYGTVNATAELRGLDLKKRSPYRPMKLKEAVKLAGSKGYQKRHDALRKQPAPDVITIETTAYALLRAARLGNGAPERRRLAAALDRLCDPVGDMPMPLLRSWQYLKSDLQLQVDGHWLNRRYVRVPLPLPLKSPTALALHLFLLSIRKVIGNRVYVETRDFNDRPIPFDKLCALLGIPATQRSRAVIRALSVVNAHVALLPDKLKKFLKIPDYVELKPIKPDGLYVQFAVAEPPVVDDDEQDIEVEYDEQDVEVEPDEADVQQEIKPRPLRARVRLTAEAEARLQAEALLANDRNYGGDLIGRDTAAKLAGLEIQRLAERLHKMSDDERREAERRMRRDAEGPRPAGIVQISRMR